MASICNIDKLGLTDDDLIFHPFEFNDNDHRSPLCEIDPDLYFYNSTNFNDTIQCNYFDETTFKEVDQFKHGRIDGALSMCHLNIRSIRKNLGYFEVYLKALDYDFSLIGISETWLQDNTCDLFHLDGYDFFETHRTTKTGGGVGLFINEKIKFCKRPDLCHLDDYMECVTIEVENKSFNMDKDMIVSVIYRPPNTETGVFVETINAFIEKIKPENKYCYLMGDYNINILNFATHSATADFVDSMYSYGFFPLINRPTRITTSSATIIDNIFTNNLFHAGASCQGIFVTDISDHLPIFHINCCQKISQESDIFVSTRNFSFHNRQSFQNALDETDWEEIYSQHDTQSAFTRFYSKFTNLYNKHFPFRKIKLRYSNRKPWLTEALKQSIRKKNKLYMKYLKIKSAQNESNYKRYKNKLNGLLKIAEKKYFAEKFENNKSNLKKTWSILKGIINKRKNNKTQEKFKLSDGSITSDKNNISERFNDFFVNIGNTLSRSIANVNKSPTEYMGERLSRTMFLEPVGPQEVDEIIKNLKDGAPGSDGIKSLILKTTRRSIIGPLCYLCNISLTEGVFPDELKLANVLPLFKSGDPLLFNNFRPVSLLCVLSKVFEKVMYSRLLSFLDEQQILIKNQFGFRKHHASYMALMLMMDEITKALNNNDCVIGVFLDFSKAFDTVNHGILLDKLCHYGIRGNALSWFKSYLTGRKQFVTYNGVASSTKVITCGVPQGSILGPLLFLLYINDLYNICSTSIPILYADDTNLFYKGKDIDTLVSYINMELKNISTWLKVNRLSLNIKRHTSCFSGSKEIKNVIWKFKLMAVK